MFYSHRNQTKEVVMNRFAIVLAALAALVLMGVPDTAWAAISHNIDSDKDFIAMTSGCKSRKATRIKNSLLGEDGCGLACNGNGPCIKRCHKAINEAFGKLSTCKPRKRNEQLIAARKKAALEKAALEKAALEKAADADSSNADKIPVPADVFACELTKQQLEEFSKNLPACPECPKCECNSPYVPWGWIIFLLLLNLAAMFWLGWPRVQKFLDEVRKR